VRFIAASLIEEGIFSEAAFNSNLAFSSGVIVGACSFNLAAIAPDGRAVALTGIFL